MLYTPDIMPAHVRWQILSYMRTEWPEGFTGRFRGRRWISAPEFNPTHLVLMEDDLVIGHVEIMWIDFIHGGVLYKTYGISSVFIFQDYRGQGLGKRMVQAATYIIRRQGDADIGMLWCDHALRGFYIKCGWQAMDSTQTLLGTTRDTANVDQTQLLFMRFFSDKAEAHRHTFENTQLYFGWTTW